MNTQLHQWLNPSRVQAMLAANEPMPMKRYRLEIGPKESPRVVMDVMGSSSTAVFLQHVDLAEPGERMVVLAGERA